MSYIANTPSPPYYAVIFTSTLSKDDDGYHDTADNMLELAAKQKGFLGVESAREELGITISYWSDLESIKQWKQHSSHRAAQVLGQERWYSAYKVRITKVEHDYNNEETTF